MTQSRRTFLARSSALGLAAVLAPELMRSARAQADEITNEVLERAEQLAGLRFTDEERELMRDSVGEHLESLRAIQALGLKNQVPPAMLFRPLGLDWAMSHYPGDGSHEWTDARIDNEQRAAAPTTPAGDDLAFATIGQIGAALRRGDLSCSEVTEFFIARLESLNPTLHFMINPTFDRARAQAKQLDAEARRGEFRGPLHGIPWGAKDLLAVAGAPTTWGAAPYRDQVGPVVPGTHFLPFGDVEALSAAITKETAAVLLEPGGAGGDYAFDIGPATDRTPVADLAPVPDGAPIVAASPSGDPARAPPALS